jgi:hypothetical protein
MIRFCLLLLLVIHLSSCGGGIYIESTSTSTYNFDILKPAESPLDTNINRIMVMPGEPTANSKIYKIKEKDKIDNTEFYIHPLLSETTDKLVDILTDSPRYTIKIPKNESAEFPTRLINWDELDSAGKNEEIDAFLILDAIQSSTCFTLQSTLLRTEREDYNPEEIDSRNLEYFYLLDTKAEFTWKIYRPFTHEITTKKILLSDEGSGLQFPTKKAALEANEEITDHLLQIADQAADKFAQTIAPIWENTSRKFFNKGNSGMREAAAWIGEGTIENAAEIWEKLATNVNPGISKEARFNLILIHELNGEFEEGLKIANDLINEYDMPAARIYVGILKVRLEDKSKLDEQLRPENGLKP